jgi:hypothetical protein
MAKLGPGNPQTARLSRLDLGGTTDPPRGNVSTGSSSPPKSSTTTAWSDLGTDTVTVAPAATMTGNFNAANSPGRGSYADGSDASAGVFPITSIARAGPASATTG